jgi:protein SCO1/2
VKVALRAAAAILVALLAVGCDQLGVAKSPFKSIDVTGAPIGGELRLTDHNGKPRTLADFRGKVVLVNFGYTQCPDVCPTTLADLATAMRKLGADASQVQVLFVTVDPKRDKPELLREYLPAFDKSFLGLYGDADATRKVENDFKIYAAERPGKTPDTYTVDHAAQTFAFDRQGKLRLVMGYGMAPDAIASDVRILLNS